MILALAVLASCQPQNGSIGLLPPITQRPDNSIPVSSAEELATAIAEIKPGEAAAFKLASGDYSMQLSIPEGADITLTGASDGSTVITLPDDVSELKAIDIVTGDEGTDPNSKFTGYKGIVQAKDAKITLKDITIKGEKDNNGFYSDADGLYRIGGLVAINTEVHAENVTITGTRFSDDLFGVQNGIAVYLAGEGEGKPAYFNNCTITDFNKGALVARDTVSHLTFINGTITGAGYTSGTAQNGIQFACPATITGNTISDIWYLSDTDPSAATGILNLTTDNCTISNNTFDKVQWRIAEPLNDETEQIYREDNVAYYINSIGRDKAINTLKEAFTASEGAPAVAAVTIPDDITSGWNGELSATITFTDCSSWSKYNDTITSGAIELTLTGGTISGSTKLSFTGYSLKTAEGNPLKFNTDELSIDGIAGGITLTATLSNSSLSDVAITDISIPSDGMGITILYNSVSVDYDNVLKQLDPSTPIA